VNLTYVKLIINVYVFNTQTFIINNGGSMNTNYKPDVNKVSTNTHKVSRQSFEER
jgi:hypothetical protein